MTWFFFLLFYCLNALDAQEMLHRVVVLTNMGARTDWSDECLCVWWRWNERHFYFSPGKLQILNGRGVVVSFCFDPASIWSVSFPPISKGGNWGQQSTGWQQISTTCKMSQMTDFKHTYIHTPQCSTSALASPFSFHIHCQLPLKQPIQYTDLFMYPMSEPKWRLARCQPSSCGSACTLLSVALLPPQFGRGFRGRLPADWCRQKPTIPRPTTRRNLSRRGKKFWTGKDVSRPPNSSSWPNCAMK